MLASVHSTLRHHSPSIWNCAAGRSRGPRRRVGLPTRGLVRVPVSSLTVPTTIVRDLAPRALSIGCKHRGAARAHANHLRARLQRHGLEGESKIDTYTKVQAASESKAQRHKAFCGQTGTEGPPRSVRRKLAASNHQTTGHGDSETSRLPSARASSRDNRKPRVAP